ncbi:hypothetical protein Sulfitobl28_09830 [Sulfitobacter pontiacus]|jgi:hypothetical protein|nr:hypothetical protein Sulfitobl28_09830 [Sulfitobacter pontiacus]|tara:strand:+ start:4447 stop:4785 length:339 start_codon:yes stop_codon:yes gene_type:complete
MNIKRRLEAMEQKSGGSEYVIVFFRTVFEAKSGGVEGEIWKATIVTGPHAGTFVERQSAETFDQFETRCRAVSQGEVGPDETVISKWSDEVKALRSKDFEVESAVKKGRYDE